MAISTYAELTSAINDWAEQAYASSLTDNFIALAEADITQKLGANYRRAVTATVAVTSGTGTIPTAATRIRSVVRDVSGSIPLIQTSLEALTRLNLYRQTGEPTHFAVKGASLLVTPLATDNFLVTYDAVLTALSGSNTTNWLLTLAPHAYLFMCLAYQRTYEEDFDAAGGFAQKAEALLDEIKGQANVAAYGTSEIYLGQVV